jgi:hypothetical protein
MPRSVEVEWMLTYHALELAVAASFRGGDPDITQLAGRLHGEESPEVRLPGQQVMDLQQVKTGNPPVAARPLDLA